MHVDRLRLPTTGYRARGDECLAEWLLTLLQLLLLRARAAAAAASTLAPSRARPMEREAE